MTTFFASLLGSFLALWLFQFWPKVTARLWRLWGSFQYWRCLKFHLLPKSSEDCPITECKACKRTILSPRYNLKHFPRGCVVCGLNPEYCLCPKDLARKIYRSL